MADVEKPVAMSSASLVVRLVGVVIIAVLVGIHLGALGAHRMPAGAPWSGVTLAILALRAIVWPVGSETDRGRYADVLFTLLALVSATMWMWTVS